MEGAGTSEKATGGPILGLSMGGEYGFADVGFETPPVDVIGPGSQLTSGGRSEVTGTLGFFVTEGVALIGGYRSSGYGESFASSQFGTNAGPFVGVSFPDLRIGSSNRNLLTLSIVTQRLAGQAKVTSTGLEAPNATLPEGNHRLLIQIADSHKRMGQQEVVFEVAAKP